MQTFSWLKMDVPVLLLVVASVGMGAWSCRPAHPPSTVRALYGLEAPRALRAAQTAVVLVDFQNEFLSGGLALPGARGAIQRAVDLAVWARREGILVVLVQNVVDRPNSRFFSRGSPATAFVAALQPQAGDLRWPVPFRAPVWMPSCAGAASTP